MRAHGRGVPRVRSVMRIVTKEGRSGREAFWTFLSSGIAIVGGRCTKDEATLTEPSEDCVTNLGAAADSEGPEISDKVPSATGWPLSAESLVATTELCSSCLCVFGSPLYARLPADLVCSISWSCSLSTA